MISVITYCICHRQKMWWRRMAPSDTCSNVLLYWSLFYCGRSFVRSRAKTKPGFFSSAQLQRSNNAFFKGAFTPESQYQGLNQDFLSCLWYLHELSLYTCNWLVCKKGRRDVAIEHGNMLRAVFFVILEWLIWRYWIFALSLSFHMIEQHEKLQHELLCSVLEKGS